MKLTRPLIFFDLETTGVSTVTDRICQIGATKLFPDGEVEKKKMLINPGVDIPVSATEVHGITNEMVAEAPMFKQIAKALKMWFQDCDIAGYNSDEYDIPLLIMEFHRCKIEFPDWELNFIDVYKVEKKVNSQKLEDTYKRYTGDDLSDAHDALVDTDATMVILQEQLKKFELPDTAVDLEKFIQGDTTRYDYAGKTYIKDGVVYWSFGKCKDRPVLEDRGYLNWALNANFPLQTQRKLKELIKEKGHASKDETI